MCVHVTNVKQRHICLASADERLDEDISKVAHFWHLQLFLLPLGPNLCLAGSSPTEQPFNIFLDFLKQQTLGTLRTTTTKSLSTATFSEEPTLSFNQVMENSFLF